jgi:hypothetical protein
VAEGNHEGLNEDSRCLKRRVRSLSKIHYDREFHNPILNSMKLLSQTLEWSP